MANANLPPLGRGYVHMKFSGNYLLKKKDSADSKFKFLDANPVFWNALVLMIEPLKNEGISVGITTFLKREDFERNWRRPLEGPPAWPRRVKVILKRNLPIEQEMPIAEEKREVEDQKLSEGQKDCMGRAFSDLSSKINEVFSKYSFSHFKAKGFDMALLNRKPAVFFTYDFPES